jgi:inner membrane protein COX18
MSGCHKGLLGLVTDWSSNEKTQAAVSSSATTTSDFAVGSLAAGGPLDAVDEAGLTSESVVNAAVTLEPGMATEGILWFTDLTAPDPMLALPFMLSASMFLNIYSKERNINVPYLQRSKSAQRWTRVLGMVALAAGPLTLQMPSAMLVYWVSSSLMGYGQFILLDRFMPLKPPPIPCKPKVDALPQTPVKYR